MTKWIKAEKSPWGLSGSLVLFNTVSFYAGRSDDWGISVAVSFYDRSITLKIFNLYIGAEVWHNA
jgi:hypothetical protein